MTGNRPARDRDESGDEKMTLIKVDGNKLIEAIGAEHAREILDVMCIDLLNAGDASFTDACEWHCGVEDRWWPITAKQLTLTDEYAVRWTDTDEAGIDDVEIIERVDDESDAESLGEWLREIAANCGSCDGIVR